jgi:hypothetical protein
MGICNKSEPLQIMVRIAALFITIAMRVGFFYCSADRPFIIAIQASCFRLGLNDKNVPATPTTTPSASHWQFDAT